MRASDALNRAQNALFHTVERKGFLRDISAAWRVGPRCQLRLQLVIISSGMDGVQHKIIEFSN
jgi:hypothetical protein